MNDHLKKFAQMVAEESSKIGTPIDTKTKDTEISVADYVANYLSNGPIKEERKDPIDTSVQTKHNSLVAINNDITPAAPKDIEAQRWNDPLKPLDQKFVTFQDMNDHYSKFLGRIQTQMSTMSGGGEVRLRMLDDVDRSTITDGRFLKYSAADRKFVFTEISETEVVYPTDVITTETYFIKQGDYYLGVNRAGPVAITLPISPSSGRNLIIKDESGNASSNPITVIGTVDNDAGGFTLQIDNGAIHLIYREGWRIV